MKLKFLKMAVAGVVLSVSGFASASLISQTGPGATLPDGDPTGFSSSVTITDNFIIDNISITINDLSSEFIADLIISLVGPVASADLMNRVGSGSTGFSSDLNGSYTFADGGSDLWASAAPLGAFDTISPGTYAASTSGGTTVSLSSLFVGTSSAGTWTLNASDNANDDINSFTSWTINIEGHSQDVPEPSTFAIFALGLLGLASRKFLK